MTRIRTSHAAATRLVALLFSVTVLGCPAKKTTVPTLPGGDGDGTGGETTFPEEAFRQQQPEPGTPRDFQLPGVTTFKLGDQIDVYLVEKHDLPIISMEINLDGGSMTDPRGKEGLASACMDMLTEGTQRLEKIAYNEALSDIASSISAYAGYDSQGLSMQTLSTHFDETFALAVETLTKPGFRKVDLDRMVKRRLEALKQTKGSPGSIAGRVAPRALYGDKHPLGQLVTEKSLKALRIADCKAYHRSYVKPAGARLFIFGDMTEAQIKDKFAALLKSWKGTPKKVTAKPRPETNANSVFFVNVPGAAQSSIYVEHFGPARQDEDYFKTRLMASVLGGGFSSRINMNLREDKGYSYGARGSIAYRRDHGYFYAVSSVRSDSTHQSILEIFTEIAGLKSGGAPATEAELTREKNGEILGLPADFATGAQALSQYRGLVYYGLPLDYYNSFVEKVSAVTLADVAAAAATHLRPEAALVLVVGDGDAAQITHKAGSDPADVPLLDGDGKPVTLLSTLTELAKSRKSNLVILDADGVVLETR